MIRKLSAKNFIQLMIALVLISLVAIVLHNSLEINDRKFIDVSKIMGLKSRQIVFGNNGESVTRKVKDRAAEIEEILSQDIYGSDIEKINNSDGKWIKVNEMTMDLIQKLIGISERTIGVFSPVIFSENLENIESPNLIEIDEDYGRVRLKCNNDSIRLSIDSIFEGIICNEAVSIYKNSNLDGALVEVGNTTGFYNYSDEESNCIKNGFESYVKESDEVFDSRYGKINSDHKSYKFFHPSDAIISCVLSRVCSVLDENNSKKVLNFFI